MVSDRGAGRFVGGENGCLAHNRRCTNTAQATPSTRIEALSTPRIHRERVPKMTPRPVYCQPRVAETYAAAQADQRARAVRVNRPGRQAGEGRCVSLCRCCLSCVSGISRPRRLLAGHDVSERISRERFHRGGNALSPRRRQRRAGRATAHRGRGADADGRVATTCRIHRAGAERGDRACDGMRTVSGMERRWRASPRAVVAAEVRRPCPRNRRASGHHARRRLLGGHTRSRVNGGA